jgi:hypothetical protein
MKKRRPRSLIGETAGDALTELIEHRLYTGVRSILLLMVRLYDGSLAVISTNEMGNEWAPFRELREKVGNHLPPMLFSNVERRFIFRKGNIFVFFARFFP